MPVVVGDDAEFKPAHVVGGEFYRYVDDLSLCVVSSNCFCGKFSSCFAWHNLARFVFVSAQPAFMLV